MSRQDLWLFQAARNRLLPSAWERKIGDSERASNICAVWLTINSATFSSFSSHKETETELFQTLSHHIRISLYDIAYKRFVGKTWSTPRLQGSPTTVTGSSGGGGRGSGGGGKSTTSLAVNQTVNFLTDIEDASLVVVLEIVVEGAVVGKSASSTTSPSASSITNQRSVGWSLVRPLGKKLTASFVSTTPSKTKDKSAPMYMGSPMALPYLEEPIEASALLKDIVPLGPLPKNSKRENK